MVNSVLNEQHKRLIEKSVLCWVATVNKDGQPNVSPKEVFELHTNNRLVFAVIASPNTLKNIKQHAKVGVSCLDIWTQKGVQMNGIAEIIDPIDNEFKELEQLLNSKNKGVFKFRNIISIKITEAKILLAPSYQFLETTEEKQIINADETYEKHKPNP
jgi:uncharacterized protein